MGVAIAEAEMTRKLVDRGSVSELPLGLAVSPGGCHRLNILHVRCSQVETTCRN